MIDPDINIDNRSDYQRATDRFFVLLSYAVVATAFFVGGLFIWWAIQPTDVIDISEEPVPVKNSYRIEDEVIEVPISFCKNIPISSSVTRSYISDSTIITLPPVMEQLPMGCYDRIIEVQIPPQAVPDEYIIRYEAEYRVNPIKTTTEKFETTPFKMVE